MERETARKIWKYVIPIDDSFTLTMPKYSATLEVQMQDDEPCIWAIVDPTKPMVKRRFFLRATGQPLVHGCSWENHLGSFQMKRGTFPLVFHLFDPEWEVKEGEERPPVSDIDETTSLIKVARELIAEQWNALFSAERNESVSGPGLYDDDVLGLLWQERLLGQSPDDPDILTERGEQLLKFMRGVASRVSACGLVVQRDSPLASIVILLIAQRKEEDSEA